MATKLDTSPKLKVSEERFMESLETISEYYRERGTGFALIDTAAVLRFWQGKPLSVESALRHSYKLLEIETGQALMQRLAAMAAAKEDTPEED